MTADHGRLHRAAAADLVQESCPALLRVRGHPRAARGRWVNAVPAASTWSTLQAVRPCRPAPPSTPSEQRWLGPRRQASTARPTGASASASGPSVVLAHEGPACGARSARPWLLEPQGRAEKTSQGEQDARSSRPSLIVGEAGCFAVERAGSCTGKGSDVACSPAPA